MKRFEKGDLVKVIGGNHAGKTGKVVKIAAKGINTRVRFDDGGSHQWIGAPLLSLIEGAKKPKQISQELIGDYVNKIFTLNKSIKTRGTVKKTGVKEQLILDKDTRCMIKSISAESVVWTTYYKGASCTFKMTNDAELFETYFTAEPDPDTGEIIRPLTIDDVGRTLVATQHLQIFVKELDKNMIIDAGGKVEVRVVTDKKIEVYHSEEDVKIKINNLPKELSQYFEFEDVAEKKKVNTAATIQPGDVIKWSSNKKFYEVIEVKRVGNIINAKIKPFRHDALIPIEMSFTDFNNQFDIAMAGYRKRKNEKEAKEAKNKKEQPIKLKVRREFISCPICKEDDAAEVFIDQSGQVVAPSKIKQIASYMYSCFDCDEELTDKHIGVYNLRKIKRNDIFSDKPKSTGEENWDNVKPGTTVLLNNKTFNYDKGTTIMIDKVDVGSSVGGANSRWIEFSSEDESHTWSGFYDIEHFNKDYTIASIPGGAIYDSPEGGNVINSGTDDVPPNNADFKFNEGDLVKLKFDWWGWKKGEELVLSYIGKTPRHDGSFSVLLHPPENASLPTTVYLTPEDMDDRFDKGVGFDLPDDADDVDDDYEQLKKDFDGTFDNDDREIVKGKEISKNDKLIFVKNYGKNFKMGDIVTVEKILPSGYGGWQIKLKGYENSINTNPNLKNNIFKYVDIVQNVKDDGDVDGKGKPITKVAQMQQDEVLIRNKKKWGNWDKGTVFKVVKFDKDTRKVFKGKYNIAIYSVKPKKDTKYIYHITLDDLKKTFEIVSDEKVSRIGKVVHPKDLKAGDTIKTVKRFRNIMPGEVLKVEEVREGSLGWVLHLSNDFRTLQTTVSDSDFKSFVYADDSEKSEEVKEKNDPSDMGKHMLAKDWEGFKKDEIVTVNKDNRDNEYGSDFDVKNKEGKEVKQKWVRYGEFDKIFIPIGADGKPDIIKTPIKEGDYLKFKKELKRRNGDVLDTSTLWKVDSIGALTRGEGKQTPGMKLELKKVHGGYSSLNWNVGPGDFFKEFKISENNYDVYELSLGDLVKSKNKLKITNDDGKETFAEPGEDFTVLFVGVDAGYRYIIMLSKEHPKHTYICGYNNKAFNHSFEFVKKLKDVTKTTTYGKTELNIGDAVDEDDVEVGDIIRTEKIYKGFRPDELITVKKKKKDGASTVFTFEVGGHSYKDISIKNFGFRKHFVYAEKPNHEKKKTTTTYAAGWNGNRGTGSHASGGATVVDISIKKFLNSIEVGDILETIGELELWIPVEINGVTKKRNPITFQAGLQMLVVEAGATRSKQGNKRLRIMPNINYEKVSKDHQNSKWWSDEEFKEMFKKSDGNKVPNEETDDDETNDENIEAMSREQAYGNSNLEYIHVSTVEKGDTLISKRVLTTKSYTQGNKESTHPAHTKFVISQLGANAGGTYRYITLNVIKDVGAGTISGTYNDLLINKDFYKIKS